MHTTESTTLRTRRAGMVATIIVSVTSALSANVVEQTVDVTPLPIAPALVAFNEAGQAAGNGLNWTAPNDNKTLVVTLTNKEQEFKCDPNGAVTSESILWTCPNWNTWATTHVYTSSLVHPEDHFKPLFTGPMKTNAGGGGGAAPKWRSGVLQVDIQADADNDSTTAQRPPAADDTERNEEEVAEQGGTGHLTGLIVPVNSGYDENNTQEDFRHPGMVTTDPSLIRMKLLTKMPAPLTVSCLTVMYNEAHFKVYDNTGNVVIPGYAYYTYEVTEERQYYIEGLSPSASVGADEIEAIFTTNTGGTSKDAVLVTVVQVDIDVDTNNDGTIDATDTGEDEYEDCWPGRIMRMDDPYEVNGDPLRRDVAAANISIRPSGLNSGIVQLAYRVGGSRVKVWSDRNLTTEIVLPKRWQLGVDVLPSVVYLSPESIGITVGEAAMVLSYSPSTAAPGTPGYMVTPTEDDARVATAITVSRTPTKSGRMSFWESDHSFTPKGANKIIDKVARDDWTTILWFQDHSIEDDDVEDCTLGNLTGLKYGGLIDVQAHATGNHIGVAAFNTQAACTAYCNAGGPNITVGAVGDYWVAYAEAAWFATEWAATTTANHAIVLLSGCNTANGLLIGSVGGRVQFGYSQVSTPDDDVFNYNILFGNMTGEWSSGQYRTAKAAFGDGSNFQAGFTMTGDGWTTLAPAPILGDLCTYIGPDPCSGRKGSTGILFDTFMDSSEAANSAVSKTAGAAACSDRRWMESPLGAHGISLDVDMTSGSGVTVKAWAAHCKNAASEGFGKELSGDRSTYGSNKQWSSN